MLLVTVLGGILVACIGYLVLPRSLKLVYVLDSAHAATTHPDGISANTTCPRDGSTLTRIVLVDEEDGPDAAWRVAFVCETECVFWVFDCWGGVGKAAWYGPFDETWDETNGIAALVAALSGIALFVVLVRTVHR
jgi:hypothetical protein